MPQVRRRSDPRRLRLMLTSHWQFAFAALNILPLPGLGAILAGWRNAHTTLLRNGILQLTLVLFGSWPLILPGLAGLAWAIHDAVRIVKATPVPRPPRNAPQPPP